MPPTLTQADLIELFEYREATGDLVWKSRGSSRHQNLIGLQAGYVDQPSTSGLRYQRHTFKVSDIIWVLMTGSWPPTTDVGDKRIVNLSDLTL